LLGEVFYYRDKALYCEEVPLEEIAARAGTPVYVYSARGIVTPFRAYVSAFGDLPHRVCYAVKANSNLAVLGLLAAEGAGFDIVSGGELYRVVRAGGRPEKVVFSGVGKTAAEIEYAIEEGVGSFNCESDAELELIDALAARQGKRARVSLRVNPDIEAQTHPYISTGLRDHKFGIDMSEAEGVYRRAARLPNLIVDGVSCHIGSQLLDTDPIWQAAERVLELAERLGAAGIGIRRLDLGGGLGVAYKSGDVAPAIEKFILGVVRRVRGRNLEILIEPGRSIVGSAGVLLTRVLYRKKTERKEFVVVDAAMNDLIRPALYQSHHEIVPLNEVGERGVITADVVGPVCETGDFLARNREIANVLPGDLLAVCTAGAYGFVLASNYNSRPRPAEVLVEGSRWRVVRERETYADLVRGE
jgi:diaminopimelate decarboxylase